MFGSSLMDSNRKCVNASLMIQALYPILKQIVFSLLPLMMS